MGKAIEKQGSYKALIEQVDSIRSKLCSFAGLQSPPADGKNELGLLYGVVTTESGTPESRLARAVLRSRQSRNELLGADMFGEPAWDILLDLFAAMDEGKRICVSSLCVAANVPPTTALRHIASLESEGKLRRYDDPFDRRRSYVVLSEAPRNQLRELLRSWLDADV